MIGARITRAFFDVKKVAAAAEKTEKRVLSRFGAFVRRGAKSLIRKRKRPAEPGKPPSSHTGVLKRFIYFAYERRRHSVVIGPIALSGKIGDAPRALEHSGRSKVVKRRRGRRVVQAVDVEAHPFMSPAFEKEKPKLPAMWRDSVRA
jgi:hypothetical protein